MKNIPINQLPDELELLIKPLLNNTTPSKEILPMLIDEFASYSATYKIFLKTPWHGYQHIRFITSMSMVYGYLLLKTLEGHYHCIRTYNEQTREFGKVFDTFTTFHPNAGTNDSLIEKPLWDSLALYHQRAGLKDFYNKQNRATAQCLWQRIHTTPHAQPITIVDLGCGMGNILLEFSKILPENSSHSISWIGVDLSNINILSAENNTGNLKVKSDWISADAVAFVKNPEHYLSESWLERYQSNDVYFVGSGILNDGVLTQGDSVNIMQRLKNHPRLKSIILTGTTKLHITHYIAKQIGFIPEKLSVDSNIRSSIDVFTPMNLIDHKKRLLEKAKEHHTLDLSYLGDLTMMRDMSTTDFEGISYVLVSGVELSPSHMNLLNQWIEYSPSLQIICSPTDRPPTELYPTFCLTPHRWKFICVQGRQDVNAFSPHFYDQMTLGSEKVLPMQQSMNLLKKVLQKRLFTALNQDNVQLNDDLMIAKNDIHKILCGIKIYTEETITTDLFLKNMKDAGISEKLFEALEDYVRIIPIHGFSDQEIHYRNDGYAFPIERSIHADTSDAALDIATKLHGQGVIDEMEYAALTFGIDIARTIQHKIKK